MSDDLDNLKKKKLNITIENLITIGFVVVTITGMYYQFKQEIELAKELPEPPVSEQNMIKRPVIRETILQTEKKVEENSDKQLRR